MSNGQGIANSKKAAGEQIVAVEGDEISGFNPYGRYLSVPMLSALILTHCSQTSSIEHPTSALLTSDI
jgi:hypothetical protein